MNFILQIITSRPTEISHVENTYFGTRLSSTLFEHISRLTATNFLLKHSSPGATISRFFLRDLQGYSRRYSPLCNSARYGDSFCVFFLHFVRIGRWKERTSVTGKHDGDAGLDRRRRRIPFNREDTLKYGRYVRILAKLSPSSRQVFAARSSCTMSRHNILARVSSERELDPLIETAND